MTVDTFDWDGLGEIPPDVSSCVGPAKALNKPMEWDRHLLRSLGRLGALRLHPSFLSQEEETQTGEVFATSVVHAETGKICMVYITGNMSREDLMTAHQVVRMHTAPLTKQEMLPAIAEMLVLCKRRKDDAEELQLTIEAFRERLSAYPADIVKKVLKDWPNENMFTPSWFELKDRLDVKARRRKGIWEALKTLVDRTSN